VSLSDEPGFEALARRIEETIGLDLAAYKPKCLRRRIAVRMRAHGVHTYTDYLAVLDREPAELEKLADSLTINVTKFFRNAETWAWLGTQVMPGLLGRRQGAVRAWSAGCASGEEAYTLAMLVAGVLGELGHPEWLPRARVDASDIGRVSLERARAARYPAAAFSECAPRQVEAWRRPVGPDEFEVVPAVRQVVRVVRRDLLVESPPDPPYDLIVCRNVVIYFDRPSQERLMQTFYQALVPDGILVLGKVETIFGPARGRFELLEARERIYRKAA